MAANGASKPTCSCGAQLVASGNLTVAIENGPVEIVSFLINNLVIFRSYVAVYERESWGR